MFLIIIISVLIVVFFSTRYGFKSSSKTVRAWSYAGVFLSVMMLFLLAFGVIGERLGQ